MILFGHDQTVAEWVSQKVKKPFHPPFTAIGVLNCEGTLIGGFVFNDYTGDSIEMSLAGGGVARRSVWKAILAYVFGQLKCSRLQIHTRRSNKMVKKLAPKLGFVCEGKARNFYGDNEDGFVYSLVKSDLNTFRSRWRLK